MTVANVQRSPRQTTEKVIATITPITKISRTWMSLGVSFDDLFIDFLWDNVAEAGSIGFAIGREALWVGLLVPRLWLLAGVSE